MTLVLDAVTVGYPGRPPRRVLTDLHLTARAGQVTALLGPNGAGKSTLLRSVAGLQRVLGGTVRLGGVDVTALPPAQRARRIAVVLTDRVDGGLLTGGEVAALGRLPHQGFASRLSAGEQQLIADSLARMGATHLANVRLHQMSDGQRQRVLIARALVQQPSLLVLDEPSAFLDVAARVELLALLEEIPASNWCCAPPGTCGWPPGTAPSSTAPPPPSWSPARSGGRSTRRGCTSTPPTGSSGWAEAEHPKSSLLPGCSSHDPKKQTD